MLGLIDNERHIGDVVISTEVARGGSLLHGIKEKFVGQGGFHPSVHDMTIMACNVDSIISGRTR